MKKNVWYVVLAMTALMEATDAAPLEAYARLPQYENVAISPDGNHLAFITTVGNEREVIIQSLTEKDDSTRVKVGDKELRGLNWAGSNHLLVRYSESLGFYSPLTEVNRLGVYDLQRKKMVDPFELPLTRSRLSVPPSGIALPPSRASVFVVAGGLINLGVYRVDLDQQTQTLLYEIPPAERATRRNWIVGEDGQVSAMLSYEPLSDKWTFSLRHDQASRSPPSTKLKR